MKNKLLHLAHMISNGKKRIKITRTDGKEIIGKTASFNCRAGEEILPNETTFAVLVFEEDFTKKLYYLLDGDIEDIDPVGWEL